MWHGRQHDDLDPVREARHRVGRAFQQGLPFGLRDEEGVDQFGDLCLLGCKPRLDVVDVAEEAERAQAQFIAVARQEARKRPDEVEHDVVDVEHQQRPLVQRQLGYLPRRFGIVAHDRPGSSRRGPNLWLSAGEAVRAPSPVLPGP